MSVKWGRFYEVPQITVRFIGSKHGEVRAWLLLKCRMLINPETMELIVLFCVILSLEGLLRVAVRMRTLFVTDSGLKVIARFERRSCHGFVLRLEQALAFLSTRVLFR